MQRILFFSPFPDETDRRTAEAAALRAQAMRVDAGPERDRLLSEADQCDLDIRIAAYLNSKDLKRPT